jgi:uncharacterized coiled-coil protein SlyX
MKKRPVEERLTDLKKKLEAKERFLAKSASVVTALRLKIDKLEHEASYVPPVAA